MSRDANNNSGSVLVCYRIDFPLKNAPIQG